MKKTKVEKGKEFQEWAEGCKLQHETGAGGEGATAVFSTTGFYIF